MHENKGPVTVAFLHAPGDRVQTTLGDHGVVEACVLERGGRSYTIAVKGGERAYHQEDDVLVGWPDDAA